MRRLWPAVPIAALSLAVLLAGCSGEAADDPAAPAPVLEQPDPYLLAFSEGGSVTGAGGSTTPANPDGCNALGQEGLDVVTHVWTVPATDNGSALEVRELTVTLTLEEPTLLDADLSVHGPDGDLLGATTDFNVQTGPTETLTVSAGLGPGDYTFTVRGCSGRGAYSLAADFTVQPAAAPAGDQAAN